MFKKACAGERQKGVLFKKSLFYRYCPFSVKTVAYRYRRKKH